MSQIWKFVVIFLFGVCAARADVVFPDQVAVEDRVLRKVGEARYSLLWKRITDAGLYVDPAQPRQEDILDPAYTKYLTIEYGLSLSAERFEKMTRKLLTNNWPAEELERHRAAIDTFCNWLSPVEPGDRYAVYWLPEHGLTLALNGEPAGTLASEAAGRIILSLWLGRASISESQRDELLAYWRDE